MKHALCCTWQLYFCKLQKWVCTCSTTKSTLWRQNCLLLLQLHIDYNFCSNMMSPVKYKASASSSLLFCKRRGSFVMSAKLILLVQNCLIVLFLQLQKESWRLQMCILQLSVNIYRLCKQCNS